MRPVILGSTTGAFRGPREARQHGLDRGIPGRGPLFAPLHEQGSGR